MSEDCKRYGLPVCNTVWTGRNFMTFRHNLLSPNFGYISALKTEAKDSSETFVNICMTMRRHIAKYSVDGNNYIQLPFWGGGK